MIKSSQESSLVSVSCRERIPEQKIMLNDEHYTLFWTPHAQDRVGERMNDKAIIYFVFLENCLNDISKQTNIIKNHSEYITIRDFITGMMAVVHVNHDEGKIRVCTIGDVNTIFPRENDFVVQRNQNRKIISFIWIKK